MQRNKVYSELKIQFNSGLSFVWFSFILQIKMKIFTKVCLVLQLIIILSASSSEQSSLAIERMEDLKTFAEIFRKSLNFDANPCNDYNNYICQNVPQNELPRKSVKLEDDDIKELFEKYIKNKSDKTDAEIKMENYLKSCENWKGKQDIKEFLQNFNFMCSKGNWPTFESIWTPEKFDPFKAIEKFYTYGIQPFFRTYIPQYRFTVYLKASKFTENEIEMIKTLLSKHGFERKNIIDDFLKFEEKWKNIFDEAKKNSNPEQHTELTYGEFKEQFGEMNWDNMLKRNDEKIPDNEQISVVSSNALQQFIILIKETDNKILANYFFVRILALLDLARDLPDTCYQQIYMNFKPILARVISNNFYNDEYKNKFLSTFRLIATATNEKMGYFKEQSIESLVEKVDNDIESKFLPSLQTDNLNQEYSDVVIDDDNYYKNILTMITYIHKPHSKRIFSVKDHNMEPLSGNSLSYLLTDVLYKQRNKPSSLLYKEIFKYILNNFMVSSGSSWEVKDSTAEECLKKFGNTTFDEIVYTITVPEKISVVKTYDEFEKIFQDQIQEEDNILKEYGLSNRKIFYASLAQNGCKELPKAINEDKVVMDIYKFLQHFQDEYNCSADTPMNLLSKCKI